MRIYEKVGKRLFDILLSFSAIIILFPLILIVGFLLMISLKGNPFFVQERPGYKERSFFLIKFRTMSNKRGADGELLNDTLRLNKTSAYIRRKSLDELPQLFNVLFGTMSLIGPRPLLMRYLPFYYPIERQRHDCKPGITGLAQVSGRNNLSWEERIQLDIHYVKNISFKNDLIIIYKTIIAVVTSRGVIVDPGSVLQNLDDQRKLQK